MGVRRILVAAGLAVVVGVTGACMRTQGQGPDVSATIVLSMVNGSCQKTLIGNDPSRRDAIHAKQGSAIRWRVANNDCPGSVEVSLKDWSPVMPLAKSLEPCSASPGNTCLIKGTVKNDAKVDTYPYAVYVGGRKSDPDLIIDP